MENQIQNYLLSLGFTPAKLGYKFLFEIISDGVNGIAISPLKYRAYTKLATKYSRSVATVEKDIQNAIGNAWLKGDVNKLYSQFGETIDMDRGKPSNKHFIFTAIEQLSRADFANEAQTQSDVSLNIQFA